MNELEELPFPPDDEPFESDRATRTADSYEAVHRGNRVLLLRDQHPLPKKHAEALAPQGRDLANSHPDRSMTLREGRKSALQWPGSPGRSIKPRWLSGRSSRRTSPTPTATGRIEQHLRELAATSGYQPSVAPLTAKELLAYGESEGLDPADGPARARLAADLNRRGQTIPWPPGRNEPCWCGSGRKYKRCCGH